MSRAKWRGKARNNKGRVIGKWASREGRREENILGKRCWGMGGFGESLSNDKPSLLPILGLLWVVKCTYPQHCSPYVE